MIVLEEEKGSLTKMESELRESIEQHKGTIESKEKENINLKSNKNHHFHPF